VTGPVGLLGARLFTPAVGRTAAWLWALCGIATDEAVAAFAKTAALKPDNAGYAGNRDKAAARARARAPAPQSVRLVVQHRSIGSCGGVLVA
jgi:hypothetical protein